METVDEDLVKRARALLEPGEIELNGIVVHTDFGSNDEAALHAATIEIGDIVAAQAGEADNTYVYSGNDDTRFGLNQHQGLTLDGDEFVWECQQLLREGTFDIVMYYDAGLDQAAIVESVREAGYRVTGVTSD